MNYVGVLEEDEYIKYKCKNVGKCCNVNHMIKYKYTKFILMKKYNDRRRKTIQPIKSKEDPLKINKNIYIEHNVILDIDE